jgi:hypothetical protein
MTTPRPPDEVFCMTCGPAAALDRDPGAPVLRCPRCGAEQRVPALPLFVVTGASGAGKTTVTEPLRLLLDCAVFEVDLTLQADTRRDSRADRDLGPAPDSRRMLG